MKRSTATALGLGTVAAAGIGLAIALAPDEAEAQPRPKPKPEPEPKPKPEPEPRPEPTPRPKPKPRPTPTPPPPPKPKPKPRPKPKPKPKPTPTPPPRPSPEPAPKKPPKAKLSKVGAAERRNAALAVVAQPDTHQERNMRRRAGQSLADWLANCAYWDTYPNAPLKLDPKKRTHKNYIRAWIRIRGYVERGLKLLPQLGPHPVFPKWPLSTGHQNWHRWALAVAFASTLRTAPKLREAFKKAWFWCYHDKKGKVWRQRWEGKVVAGVKANPEGLLADAGVWLGGPRTWPSGVRALERWPETVTKAYLAANDVMVKV